MSAPARAAIDIGTNSTNLLIVDGDGHRERWSDESPGSGRTSTSAADPEAVGAHLATPAVPRSDRERNVTDFRVAATSGATPRIATRPGAVRRGPRHRASTALRRGRGAARVSWLTSDLHHLAGAVPRRRHRRWSTERARDRRPAGDRVDGRRRRDLTEAELHGDPPAPDELANALAVAQAPQLEGALLAVPALAEASTVVGIASTITTVAAVEIGLHFGPGQSLPGFQLRREDRGGRVLHSRHLSRSPPVSTIRGCRRARRRHRRGCCMLVTILRRLQLPAIRVSDHNLLDGLLEESST